MTHLSRSLASSGVQPLVMMWLVSSSLAQPTQDIELSYDIIPGTTDLSSHRAIANAGDVNADGVPDQIIGTGNFVFFGGDPIVEVRSGVDGSVIHSLSGPVGEATFGFSVGGAGDLNADGHADFLVGMPESGGPGRAMAYSGADGSLLHTILPAQFHQTLGYDLTGVGDVDADGHDDFAVGAIQGPIKIYSGANGLVLQDLVTSFNSWDGSALDGGADFDQDGVPDVIAGAPFSSVGAQDAGRVRVHSGGNGTILLTINGGAAQERLGMDVTFIDDVDGDGITDLAASGFRFLEDIWFVRVYSGGTAAELWSLDGAPGDFLGAHIDTIGDYDGDGHEDLLVSANGSERYGLYSGTASVLSGVDGAVLLEWSAPVSVGTHGTGYLASGLASAGDLDGDGRDEWLMANSEFFVRVYSASSPGTPYCSASPNSTGTAAEIRVAGNRDVTENDFLLMAEKVPDQMGLFHYGSTQVQTPFGNGLLCVGGSSHRLAPVMANDGLLVSPLDLANPPSGAGLITAGSTWNFQAMFRDSAAGGSGFDLSNGVQVAFHP